MFIAPGVHQLPKDTKYLDVGVRIQVFNPKDAEEVPSGKAREKPPQMALFASKRCLAHMSPE